MTNYLEINIGGESIGLKFGLPAVRRISESADKYPLVDANGFYNQLGAAHILYGGYLNNMLVKELAPVHDLSFFVDHVEMAYLNREEPEEGRDWDTVIATVKFFASSFVVKSLNDKAEKKTKAQQPNPDPQNPLLTAQPTGTESSSSATGNSD